ncbi:zinc metalloprotease, putative [Ixodes scapularis]|uniref:Zinc metalloprotease, putative n=1 Tax=Ixodes scapularis TaxID=6945 RepID=B7PNM8_IXOSC|nr:zinc metalloprotease, putative [Ixodes scapularis]|eukprot:XP_002435376.1 zinc metalloprotease, putative [Ixodes scapularis]
MADRTAEGTGFFLVLGGLGIRWGGLRYLAYWGLLSGVLVLVLGLVGFVSLPSVHWAMGSFGSSPPTPPERTPLSAGGTPSSPRDTRPAERRQGGSGSRKPLRLRPSDSACGTHACVEQATRIQAELEYSVDPCVDFYHFVCSRWIQRHPHASVDRLQLDTYLSAMADLLERTTDDVPEMSRFFGNCIRPQENLFSEIRATFFYLLGFQVPPRGRYVLGLFNRGALPRATDLLNYLLFRIVVVLSPFMANATLRDAMSRAYGAPGESSPPTPRQLCVRLLDRFEPVIPMYLATNMSLSYLGPEEVVFEKYVDEFFASTGDFRSSSLQALRDMTWDLVRPSTIEDASFRRQYLDGLYSNMPMSPLAYFYYFWLKKAVARQLRGVGSHSPGSQLWAGWSGGFLSALPRLEPPFRRLELPLPVFNLALTDDASVRHFQIPRVAPRVYAELLRFLYHRALNNKGNLTDAAEDPAAMFERVRACVREQYAPLRSSPAERGSSVQDALELLAVVPAFEAYRSHLTSDFRLQTASDLSGRQLFFVYFAASLCEDESLGVGPGRSPARLRVNGPLRNMPEFADAFKCPVGSFMNPTKVCAL